MPQHIVIIGNGISGVTCARHIRKQNASDAITIISSETEHFYSRTALMYIFMGHMKYEHTKPYEDWFWEKNRIGLVMDHVVSIDIGTKQIHLDKGQPLSYDKLVLATGSVSNKPEFPGIELKGVQGLYGMPDLHLMNENTLHVNEAVMVGGGLIGIEMTEMLLSRNIPVTFLIRESLYWNNILPKEEASLISRHIQEHPVQLKMGKELKAIIGDSEGKVKAVVTTEEETIPCQFVGITVGVRPNISILANTPIETNRGILINEFFETSVPDVYAIGDCVEHRHPPIGRKAVEQVWYTGRIHGETLARTLTGKKTAYQPGPWFNSAKFFDIEYQNYGNVNPQDAENECSFYWEDVTGRICFRAVYQRDTQRILGFNALGMRLRHEVCDKWLQEKKQIDEVMANLHHLNFDPEFFDNYEASILAAYNSQTNKKIKSKKKPAFTLFSR